MKALALAVAALLAAGTASAQEKQLRGDALQEQPVFGYGAPNDTVSTPAQPPIAADQTAEIPDEQKLAYPTDKREPSLAKELTDRVRQRNQQQPAK